jgi:hypothetical protein
LPEPHPSLDDAEDRLHGLLAPRLRGAAPIDRNVAEILERYHVGR